VRPAKNGPFRSRFDGGGGPDPNDQLRQRRVPRQRAHGSFSSTSTGCRKLLLALLHIGLDALLRRSHLCAQSRAPGRRFARRAPLARVASDLRHDDLGRLSARTGLPMPGLCGSRAGDHRQLFANETIPLVPSFPFTQAARLLASSPPWGRGFAEVTFPRPWVRGVMQEIVFVLHQMPMQKTPHLNLLPPRGGEEYVASTTCRLSATLSLLRARPLFRSRQAFLYHGNGADAPAHRSACRSSGVQSVPHMHRSSPTPPSMIRNTRLPEYRPWKGLVRHRARRR